MLFELMGLRCELTSMAFRAQFKKPGWHARPGDVYADVTMNRIVHNAMRLCMGEGDVRKRVAERGAQWSDRLSAGRGRPSLVISPALSRNNQRL